MSSTAQAIPDLVAAPPAEAVAALRRRPEFAQAMRISATGLVDLYEGGRLLDWLMDDRGRLVFGYIAFYLHFTRRQDDPTSGLTPTRMKELCAELDVCSPGRVVAMLSLMRFAGYLAADHDVTDRRHRRLVATDKLLGLLMQRWRLHFSAMAPLFADGPDMLAALDDPAFVRGLMAAMFVRFHAGFRIVMYSPGIGLFGERNAGMMILTSLLISGEAGDLMPPTRPIPLSISSLARRFSVSRPHVLKLMRDAAAAGLIERVGNDGAHVLLTPQLAVAAQNVFATMFLYFADCAREALREMAAGRARM